MPTLRERRPRDEREDEVVREQARPPQHAMLALQRSAGNAAVTRVLQRDFMDDLLKQRARARGMTPEDAEREQGIIRFGAQATAEAQELHPMGPSDDEVAAIELALSGKQETGPHWDPTGPLTKPGALATEEAQALHPPGPSDDEVGDLEAAQTQKQEIGKSRNILNSLKNKQQREAAEQRRAAQALAAQQLRAQQESVRGDPKEREQRIKTHEKTHPDVLEAERVKRQDEYEKEFPLMMARRALEAVQRQAATLKATIQSAHAEIRNTLAASVMARIEAAEKGAPSDHAKHADAIAKASKEFSDHKMTVENNRERKANNRLTDLKNANLAEALNYAAPALVTANTAVQGLVAAKQWLDIAPKIDTLESEFAPFKNTLPIIADVQNRATYVRNHHNTKATVAPAELVHVENRLNTRHATAPAGMSELAKDLQAKMVIAEKPVAVSEFNAVANLGQWTNAKNVLQTLYTEGLIRPGVIQEPYRTNWDGAREFSVEITVQNLQDIVIHSHCTEHGSPKDGENAAHWKYKSEKFDPGTSHPIPDNVRKAFIRANAAQIREAARRKGYVK